jgi:hypothetical protein
MLARVRWRWCGWSALIAALAAGSLACEDGAARQRGFGSHQVAQFRDPTFTFIATRGERVYYVTYREEAGAAVATYWSLDVGTREIRNLGATRPDFTAPPATDRYRCEFESDENGLTGLFTITDTQSGMVTGIEQVYTTWPSCPTNEDPALSVWRYEADDSYSLWMGPFTYLVQAPLSIVVRQVLWREDGATLVSGSSSGATDNLGVFSITDQDPSVATELIPATLAGGAWAGGATASTALTSSGLFWPSLFWEGTPGHYGYVRLMTDGSQVMFVGPYASAGARELALFAIVPDSELTWLRIAPFSYRYDGKWPLTTTWRSVEPGVPGSTFRIWHEPTARLVTCPWPAAESPAAMGDPAEENALFWRSADGFEVKPDSALLLMAPNAPDGNRCRFLATEHVWHAGFSPDGTAMVWLVEPPGGKATLWTAGRDGSAPREIGTGSIGGTGYTQHLRPRFLAGSQLELTLNGDLVWIDVHDDPVRTHYITEQAFGTPIDLGRWVVTGHHYSDQDANGSLALVNRESGEHRPISSAVESYTSPDEDVYRRTPGVPSEDDRPVRIVYLVRGRNPSSQDGLWVATIRKDDRQ